PQDGWAVIGVGLNLTIATEEFPEELQPTATSLAIEQPDATAFLFSPTGRKSACGWGAAAALSERLGVWLAAGGGECLAAWAGGGGGGGPGGGGGARRAAGAGGRLGGRLRSRRRHRRPRLPRRRHRHRRPRHRRRRRGPPDPRLIRLRRLFSPALSISLSRLC